MAIQGLPEKNEISSTNINMTWLLDYILENIDWLLILERADIEHDAFWIICRYLFVLKQTNLVVNYWLFLCLKSSEAFLPSQMMLNAIQQRHHN